MNGRARDHFQDGGAAYARFRPDYPPETAAALADIAALWPADTPTRPVTWPITLRLGRFPSW